MKIAEAGEEVDSVDVPVLRSFLGDSEFIGFLFLRALIAFAPWHAAGEMHVVLIRPRGAHCAETPVARSRMHARKPGLRI